MKELETLRCKDCAYCKAKKNDYVCTNRLVLVDKERKVCKDFSSELISVTYCKHCEHATIDTGKDILCCTLDDLYTFEDHHCSRGQVRRTEQ